MSAPDVLVVLGLAFGVIEQFNAKGRSLLAWAVILVCVALLWGALMALGDS